jgi:localization factor PodJL
MPSNAMKPGVPWSVKGVDLSARDAAKDAARRAGMTLGEWLNAVIADTASDGEPRHHRRTPLEQEDPMAALAERLARVTRASAETAPLRSERHDLSSVLDRAIAESRRQAEAVEERTADALGAVLRLMERGEAQRRTEIESLAKVQERTSLALRDAVALVTRRLDGLEAGIADQHGADLEPVRSALGRLEQRIDTLSERQASGGPGPRVEQSLRELEQRLVDIAEKIVSGEAGEPAGLEGDIARIEARFDAALDEVAGRIEETAHAASRTHELEDAVTQIRARQARIEAEHQQALPATRTLDALREDISGLAKRLETLGAPRPVAGLDVIHRDLRELSDAVGKLAPRSDLAALERTVREIAEKVADTRDPVLHDGLFGLIERLKPLADMPRLREDVEALAGRLDAIPAAMLRPADLDAITRQIRDLQSEVEAMPAKASTGRFEQQLSALSERLDGVAAQHGASDSRNDQALADIRAALETLNPREDIGRLEYRIDALAEQIEELANRPADEGLREQVAETHRVVSRIAEREPAIVGALDELKHRLGRVDAVLAAPVAVDTGALEALVRAIDEKVETAGRMNAVTAQAGLGEIRERLDQFSSRLDQPETHARLDAVAEKLTRIDALLESRPAPDTSALEDLVRSLGDKIEAARQPDAHHALAALEQQISDMARALDRSGESADTLRSLERSVGELFSRIDQTRDSALEAVQAAARETASEFSRSMPQSPLAVAMADGKSRETLTAVQETLQVIVERLGVLESDLSSDRARFALWVERAGSQSAIGPAPSPAPATAPSTAEKIAAAARAAEAARALASTPPRSERGARTFTLEAAAEAQALAAMARTTASKALKDVAEAGPDSATAPAPEDELAAGTTQPPATVEIAPSFIAAARKAVMSSAAKGGARLTSTQEEAEQSPDASGDDPDPAKGRGFLSSRKRPILIGIAAIVLALSTAQIVRNVFDGPQHPAHVGEAGQSKDTAPRSEARTDEARPAAAIPAESPALQQQSLSVPGQNGFTIGPVGPVPEGFNSAKPDPATVGSVTPAPNPAPTVPAQPPPQEQVSQVPSDLPALPTGTLPKGLQKLAMAGQPSAAYEVGARLSEGRGVARDPVLAARWFERAAQYGSAPAQYRLGSVYEKGIGVAKDLAVARMWYERAAQRGNAKAMHNLGVLMADGAGAKPDYAAAAGWFRKAAEFGVRDSQYNLAILTARGLGVEQNLAESWVWFQLAAGQGDEDAAKKRDEVAGRLDPQALATARARAAAFKPLPLDPTGNEVTPPAGGWDSEASARDRAKAARG